MSRSNTNSVLELFHCQGITKPQTKNYQHRKVTFKPHDNTQKELFPEDMEAIIGSRHIARFIDTGINALDIDNLVKKYKGGGASAYHPRLLLKVWLLGFVYKTYSCRGIAKLLQENIAFKWISGNTQIDFHTLNNFRLRLDCEMKSIFRQILQFALKNKIIQGKDIFIDHSKFEANANRFRIVWRKNVDKQISKLDEELNALFSYVKRLEISENKKYGSSGYPEKLQKSYSDTEIAKMISEANDDLKNKAIDRQKTNARKKKFRRLKVVLHRLRSYRRKRLSLYKRRSFSMTDPDATAMRQKDETLKAGYNEGVATENGLVLDYHISNTSADTDKLIDIVEGVKENTDCVPDSLTADSAYGSQSNYEYLEKNNIKANVKYSLYHPEKTNKYNQKRVRSNQFLYEKETNSYRCPEGKKLNFEKVKQRNRYGRIVETYIYSADASDCASCRLRLYCTTGKKRSLHIDKEFERLKKKAREQLHSDEGRRLSRNRGFEVETVFGHKKHNAFYRRYLLRGKGKVGIETGLFYTSYNLQKMYCYFMKTFGSGGGNLLPDVKLRGKLELSWGYREC